MSRRRLIPWLVTFSSLIILAGATPVRAADSVTAAISDVESSGFSVNFHVLPSLGTISTCSGSATRDAETETVNGGRTIAHGGLAMGADFSSDSSSTPTIDINCHIRYTTYRTVRKTVVRRRQGNEDHPASKSWHKLSSDGTCNFHKTGGYLVTCLDAVATVIYRIHGPGKAVHASGHMGSGIIKCHGHMKSSTEGKVGIVQATVGGPHLTTCVIDTVGASFKYKARVKIAKHHVVTRTATYP